MSPLSPAPLKSLVLSGAILTDAWAKWFRDLSALLGFEQGHSRIITPTFAGLVTVGTVGVSLVYVKDRQMVGFSLILAPSGGGTVAANAGSTYVENLPYEASHDAGAAAVNAVSLASLGGGRVDAATKRLYLPTFAATANKVIVSGWYRTEV